MHHHEQYLEGLSLLPNLHEDLGWCSMHSQENKNANKHLCMQTILLFGSFQSSFDNTYSSQKYWWTEILGMFDLIKGREKAGWRYILPNAASRPMTITSERPWRFANSFNHLCIFYYLRKQTDKIWKNSWNASEK